eukprot:752115-Hanusia_phi.AAC.7
MKKPLSHRRDGGTQHDPAVPGIGGSGPGPEGRSGGPRPAGAGQPAGKVEPRAGSVSHGNYYRGNSGTIGQVLNDSAKDTRLKDYQ